MAQQIVVFAFLKAKPGFEAELQAEMLKVVDLTRQEQGCVQYDLHVDANDSTSFGYYEIWESDEALAAHAKAPHMDAFRHFREGKLDGPVVIETYRKIK
ncbi:MAG: putative quinol monooxygenase [Bryobacteraceae bacterium]